ADRRERERLGRNLDVLVAAAVVLEHRGRALRRGCRPRAPELQLEVRAVRLGLPAGARGAVREVADRVGEPLAIVLHDVPVLVDADDDLMPEIPATLGRADLERRVDAPADGRREVLEEAVLALDAERFEAARDELHLERAVLVDDAGAEVVLHEAPEHPDLLGLDVLEHRADDGSDWR